MEQNNKKQDQALGALFEAAQKAEPIPSGDLMARIMADAAQVQSQATQTVRPVARIGLFKRVSAALGGWTGVSTLAACACVGIVVGFASPDVVMSYVPGLEADTGDELLAFYFEDEV